jgi:hypothetical protein
LKRFVLLTLLLLSCKKAKVEPAPPAKARAGFRVTCNAPGTKISPHIYGIAFDVSGHSNWRDEAQWTLRPSGRRFGGNAATRYNVEHGTAFNNASDWYFENNGDQKATEPTYITFLRGNAEHQALSAMQLPMIGWVAKDTTSVGFPLELFAGQKFVDEKRKAGKGVLYSGREVDPGPPTQTSVAAPPEKVASYVQRVKVAANGERIYILDNEPALWHVTHRDIHPEPVSTDELIERTVRYAAAIRAADPTALIAGPAAYGWNELFRSAKDQASPSKVNRDREAHGGDPLIVTYLKKLREHEQKTGVRLLDLLDVHFYPQGEGTGVGTEGAVTQDVSEVRKRSARALWDEHYVDESWIAEPIMLLPRLRTWIDANYPGTKIQIGEWNYGAEKHISSGLAVAETLGQFARNNVYSAFYWTIPPVGSPAAAGFRAFRNYDGKGASFGQTLLPSEAEEGTSLFVSRDDAGKRYVAVAINFDHDREHQGVLELTGCGKIQKARMFTHASGEFVEQPVQLEPNGPQIHLKRESLSVVEVWVE